MAILGNAGGTIARAFGVYYPDAAIDGVEIDPAVTRSAGAGSGSATTRALTVHDADARPVPAPDRRRYDLIFVDAYHQPYVPFYLATQEFFRLVRDRLAPGGIVALTSRRCPRTTALVRGITGTLAARVPAVAVWHALRFNRIVLGFDRSRATAGSDGRRALEAAVVRSASADLDAAERCGGRPWTDDRAPVEWVTDRMIVELRRARRRARRGLPSDRAVRMGA